MPQSYILKWLDTGLISRCGGCGGSATIVVYWPALTFSTLLCVRIMNQLRCRAKFMCRIPPAHGMPLNPHREHVIAASSWNEDAS